MSLETTLWISGPACGQPCGQPVDFAERCRSAWPSTCGNVVPRLWTKILSRRVPRIRRVVARQGGGAPAIFAGSADGRVTADRTRSAMWTPVSGDTAEAADDPVDRSSPAARRASGAMTRPTPGQWPSPGLPAGRPTADPRRRTTGRSRRTARPPASDHGPPTRPLTYGGGYGQPSAGAYGQIPSSDGPASYGPGGYATAPVSVPYGQPGYGQPGYDQPGYGQRRYDEPGYGTPTFADEPDWHRRLSGDGADRAGNPARPRSPAPQRRGASRPRQLAAHRTRRRRTAAARAPPRPDRRLVRDPGRGVPDLAGRPRR